jgi:hypothetical protein
MSVSVCYRFQLETPGRGFAWTVDRRWDQIGGWDTSRLWHKDQGDPAGLEAYG